MAEHGFSLSLVLEYFTQWVLLGYKNNKKVSSSCWHKKTKTPRHTKQISLEKISYFT